MSGEFQELGHCPFVASLMAGLGTVMVPVGVSCSSLMCYTEVQGLVDITSSPS